MQLKYLFIMLLALASSPVVASPADTLKEYQAQLHDLRSALHETSTIEDVPTRGMRQAQLHYACNALCQSLALFGEQIFAMKNVPVNVHIGFKITHKSLQGAAVVLMREIKSASPSLRPPTPLTIKIPLNKQPIS